MEYFCDNTRLMLRSIFLEIWSEHILIACVCCMECSWICSLCEFASCLPDICTAVKSSQKYSNTVFSHDLIKISPTELVYVKERLFFHTTYQKNSVIKLWWMYWIFAWSVLMSRYLFIRCVLNCWMQVCMSSVFSKTSKFFPISTWWVVI